MAHSLTTPTGAFGKLFTSVAIAAALCVSSSASADVINFEGDMAMPWLFNDQAADFGNYTITGLNNLPDAQPTDMVAAVTDTGSCANYGLQCPVNNNTNYLATLDDSFLIFGRNDGLRFQMKNFKASFIGAAGTSYPANAGLLQIRGFHANGSVATPTFNFGLGGPSTGAFRFADYNTGALGKTTVSFIRIIGYQCLPAGCDRSSNYGNFAIDDISMVTIPEPATFGLMGLGLLGLAAFSRRRAA